VAEETNSPYSIRPINVDEEVKNSFLDYSMSVIIARALPDVRDGLKPSQRRLLYAMNELGVQPNRKHLKCAKIVGETMGNYHPHGDQAIYPTLVNMAQPWGIREALVDGQGNFGSVEGDPPAAMRYTEARLTHLGSCMLSDLDMETVDWVPNYDETRVEPTVLPSAFPQLLVNGGTGIAVGMATNMPPHNLGEIVDAICAQIDNPDITAAQLNAIVPGPDFPTGCTIHGIDGIREYFETGHGSVRIRGHAEIVENGNREQIVITAIPYGVNRAVLVERIAELAQEKILPEIGGVRDESDENTRVVVELKREARAQVVLNNLFKHTSLETSFSIHMLAIDNRRPRVLSMKDAIACYIEHRREVVLRRTRFLLRKAQERAEKLEAFLGAIGHLDDFIRIIRESRSREEAFGRLKEYSFSLETARGLGIVIGSQPSVSSGRYVFSDVQVNHILELRLYQLTGMEQDKVKAEYDEVLGEISDFHDILARESRVLSLIKDELQSVRARYGTPRLTKIQAAEGEIRIEDLIANKAFIVTLTHRGYIKRTLASEYRLQGRGGKGLKGMETREAAGDEEKGDFVEHLFTASAHDYLMFFTNTGRVYVERVYQLPEAARTGKGRSIKNVLNLRPEMTVERERDGQKVKMTFPEEKIAAILRLEAAGASDEQMWREDRFALFGTKDGTVKKTALSDFRNVRKDGIVAIQIEEGDELIQVILTDGGNEICLSTHEGMCVRCEEGDIRAMGRSSIGVRGVRLEPGDFMVSLTAVDFAKTMLVVSENGLGKRTSFEEYRLTNRGGKGVITMNVTEKTGKVVAALAVAPTEELMLMTSSGQSVRIRVSDIRETGRNAQGVKLMDLAEREVIQDVAIVVPDEEDESSAVAEDAAEAAMDSNTDQGAADSAADPAAS
jgi:DNA gyrase subunit A